MRRLASCCLCLGLALAGSAAGVAAEPESAAAYDDCMRLAQDRPGEGFERALAWQSEGGGDAARHCAAVALVTLGHHDEGARRLEALAESVRPEHTALRAEILGQAGLAWLLAGDPTRAHAVQSTALQLDPKNLELWVDRSVALATGENYWEAIDDLNRALELDPARADVLILRASAYRYVDALDLALEDVTQALALSPESADGLLERGILRRLIGDQAGARVDWLAAATLGAGTPAADAARTNLELMDVKVE